MMPEILVTGASGFIGKGVVARLLAEDVSQKVAVAVRRDNRQLEERVVPHVIGDLESVIDWSIALRGINAVVHCAARVHVIEEKSRDPLEAFRRANVQGTLNLASQAAAAGVKRFVFVSSIKVNGEMTQLGSPFKADDEPAPLDAYGISKMEAEQGLREIARQTDMELVIIRPPLVYGPGVKANFAALMRWLQIGVPLPLGAIPNRRSMVALDNLVDLIVTCLSHHAAANQIFLVSDCEDVSTTDLLRRMGIAAGWPVRLVPVPANWLKLVALMIGKQDVAERLCGSLQVDVEKTQRLLGWVPPLSLDEGLKKATKGVTF